MSWPSSEGSHSPLGASHGALGATPYSTPTASHHPHPSRSATHNTTNASPPTPHAHPVNSFQEDMAGHFGHSLDVEWADALGHGLSHGTLQEDSCPPWAQQLLASMLGAVGKHGLATKNSIFRLYDTQRRSTGSGGGAQAQDVPHARDQLQSVLHRLEGVCKVCPGLTGGLTATPCGRRGSDVKARPWGIL